MARPEIEAIDAKALVDSGALELCIPKHLAIQLKLETVEQREITTADGAKHLVDYVGPVRVEMFGRKAITGALVVGDEVLLGAVPMETMDVLIDPRRMQVIPNPDNPNVPAAIVKGAR